MYSKLGLKGSATKMEYIEKYGLQADRCLQGQATTDEEICEFLQTHINTPDVQCLVVISDEPAHAYRMPSEEATETGIAILGQLVFANKDTLRIFHLNGQHFDWNESSILGRDLRECTQLQLVDLYDCMITNHTCWIIFEALKKIPTLTEINFGKNEINAETREKVQNELEEVNKWRQGDIPKKQVIF